MQLTLQQHENRHRTHKYPRLLDLERQMRLIMMGIEMQY